MRRPPAPRVPTEAERQELESDAARLADLGDGLRREIAVVVGTKAPMPSLDYLRRRIRCGRGDIDRATAFLLENQLAEIETEGPDGQRWRARITRNGDWMPWSEWGDR